MVQPTPTEADDKPDTLLEHFFAAISETGTTYCVLRNFETLPASVPGSDIDLLVASCDRKRVERQLTDLASSYGWQLERRYPKTYQITHLRLVRPVPNGCPEILRFDLMDHIGMGPMRFYSGDVVLADRRHAGSVMAPSPEMEQAINMLNAAYDGHPLKIAYRNKATMLAKEGDNLRHALARCIGNQLATRMIATLDGEGPQILRRSVRRKLWLQTCKHRPVAIIADCIQFLFMVIGRIAVPPGTMVVLLGPDGVGKSTAAQKIAQTLSKAFSGVVVGHLRPWLLPRIKTRLVGDVAKPNPAESDLRGLAESPHGLVISLLRLGYAGLDYIFGYWLRIHLALAKGQLVIFDRYYHDYFADHHQKGVNLPEWLLRPVCRLFPSPHRVFVLAAGGDIVHSRRRDLSAAEAERQVLAFTALARNDPTFTIIDASRSADEVEYSICNGIMLHESPDSKS